MARGRPIRGNTTRQEREKKRNHQRDRLNNEGNKSSSRLQRHWNNLTERIIRKIKSVWDSHAKLKVIGRTSQIKKRVNKKNILTRENRFRMPQNREKKRNIQKSNTVASFHSLIHSVIKNIY